VSFSPYPTTGSISYPPFSAFIFASTYRFYALLGEPSQFLYYFLLKQPMVLADVGVAIVLARIILFSGDAHSARTAFLIWLYFPLGIIISSMWGQLDPLALFLSLLSIYFFLSSKWLPSAAMLGLAIYLKTLPVVFLPVLLMRAHASPRNKLNYSLISLSIPFLGTLLPTLAFNWGFQGLYNNVSFQVAIPSTGAMSFLGQVHIVPSLLAILHPITGIIWVPALLAAYSYAWKKNLPLFQGLLISILAFSISRPFLPEQWSLYPLALLLLTSFQARLEHFVGLAVASTGFLIANNTLLVRFFTPLSVEAFNWDVYIIHQSPYVALRAAFLLVTALLYFTESILVITGGESIVHRAIVSVSPAKFLRKSRISPTEVHIA
jgi:mannosyltransferase PIG-M